MANLCNKLVTPDEAYEIWRHNNGMTYYVLRKYQDDKAALKNKSARWRCWVTSPQTPQGSYGDVFVANVMEGGRKLSHNPRHKHADHRVEA